MSVAENIKRKIEEKLAPAKLEIVDESHKHEGHAGHREEGESHFRLLIVSDSFDGLTRVARQRLVFDILSEEMITHIHALSLKCLTTAEY